MLRSLFTTTLTVYRSKTSFNYIRSMAPVRRSTRISNLAKPDPFEVPAEKAKSKITKQSVKKSTTTTKPEVSKVSDKPTVKKTEELNVGDAFPDGIVLLNQESKSLDISKIIKENKVVVIFAYPKASTPGCTRQACGFRDTYSNEHYSGSKDVVVFGISADSPKAQATFKARQSLPFDLLSDEKRELIGLFGAKKTEAKGVTRSHWVFSEGTLKYKHVKISPEDSIRKAKEEVAELLK